MPRPPAPIRRSRANIGSSAMYRHAERGRDGGREQQAPDGRRRRARSASASARSASGLPRATRVVARRDAHGQRGPEGEDQPGRLQEEADRARRRSRSGCRPGPGRACGSGCCRPSSVRPRWRGPRAGRCSRRASAGPGRSAPSCCRAGSVRSRTCQICDPAALRSAAPGRASARPAMPWQVPSSRARSTRSAMMPPGIEKKSCGIERRKPARPR